ncbi:CD151 antigen-like isoform X2 [Phymastichus coffea]|uniref:CD151 antigen-like isoform X2 n=1 Tax=Phymastichus coffea TaxID=108790 RepID=UPI00273A9DA3|nr:CD151 antigen-like isoform X2 [Phymastichus coffea]XP_058794801.1 CD151 antigen-like isoform X2 [Phymastichus coffea]
MKYAKVALFTFNLLIWLTGCTVMVVGVWLLMEPGKGHLLNLFAPDEAPHETVYIVAYGLVGLGVAVLVVGFFGCRAVMQTTKCSLATYMSLLITLIVAEIATAAVLGFMAYKALTGLESRLIERLSNHYGHDSSSSDVGFSHSLDFAQYKFNCCGIYKDTDFNGTQWWRDSLASGTRKQVPLTCCVLKDTEAKNTGSPMSVISRVFYKNNEKPWLYPRPKDENACQAQEVTVHTGFRHKDGCLEKIRTWFHDESFTLIVFALTIVGAQIFGIVVSSCLCKAASNEPPNG